MQAAGRAEGLLYVEVDCPPELESEFHAWYNLEHVPERMSIPGFVSGRRYAALEGLPRWLATYELTSAAVLESPEYRKWLGGPLQTAWTTRMIASTRVHRSVFRLAVGRDSAPTDKNRQALLAVRYVASPEESGQLSRWHDTEFSRELLEVPGVLSSARYDGTEGNERLVLYELEQPWLTQEAAFGRLWTAGWETRRASLSSYRRVLYLRIL
ncbi:MAG TPA: hypothetical protein VEU07_02970 [Candidatus Acidoferrum sp.]|nr:hypothetical protein [Candidatus Acidoferrum sp.]